MAARRRSTGPRKPRSRTAPLTTPRFLFALSADALAKEAASSLVAFRDRMEGLVARSGPRTVGNLLVPYDRMLFDLSELQGQTKFLFDVHPDAAVRETADKWYQEAERFATDLALNRPLYDAFVAFDVSKQDADTRFAVHKILRDFRLAGVDKPEATRGRIKELRDAMIAIGQDFDRVIREDVRSVQFNGPQALTGLPEDFVRAHPPGADGKVTITTQYQDTIPVLRYARDPDVRRRLQREFLNRGYPTNAGTLGKLLAIRHELATILGYESFAD